MEFSVLVVLVLGVLLLGIHTAFYLHGQHIASQAAQTGVDLGRRYDAAPGAGRRAAQAFLDDTGSLQATSVSAGRAGEQYAVTVTGKIPTIMPGVQVTVRHRAQGAVEQP